MSSHDMVPNAMWESVCPYHIGLSMMRPTLVHNEKILHNEKMVTPMKVIM